MAFASVDELGRHVNGSSRGSIRAGQSHKGPERFYLSAADKIGVCAGVGVKRPSGLLRGLHHPFRDGDIRGPHIGPRERPFFPGGLWADLTSVGGLGSLVGPLRPLPLDHALGGGLPLLVPLGRSGLRVLRRPGVAGLLVRLVGRFVPTGEWGGSPFPARVHVIPGPVAVPLLGLSALAAPTIVLRVGRVLGQVMAGPAQRLSQAVLLVKPVMPSRERRAVPAQRVGARDRHVLKLIEQPGQGTVLGRFVSAHDGLTHVERNMDQAVMGGGGRRGYTNRKENKVSNIKTK